MREPVASACRIAARTAVLATTLLQAAMGVTIPTVKQQVGLFCLALSWIQCGGSSEPNAAPPDSAGENSQQSVEEGSRAPEDEWPSRRQTGPIPLLGACSDTVQGCDESIPVDAITSPFSSAAIAFLHQSCNFYCGRLEVSFRQGCVALVDGDLNGIQGVRGLGQGIECIGQQLLGSRWECGPGDGVVSVYLGSCTIQ